MESGSAAPRHSPEYDRPNRPHVFILIMQYNDFRENDRHRVKTVLNLFSEQAMKHTIVLITDEETRGHMSPSYESTN
ncbi:hypothetical protein cypCar_00035607 [Cyprinus carpio]|nr:hypothetical protein cypCar_00035607 [Cyprinus carpio]